MITQGRAIIIGLKASRLLQNGNQVIDDVLHPIRPGSSLQVEAIRRSGINPFKDVDRHLLGCPYDHAVLTKNA